MKLDWKARLVQMFGVVFMKGLSARVTSVIMIVVKRDSMQFPFLRRNSFRCVSKVLRDNQPSMMATMVL